MGTRSTTIVMDGNKELVRIYRQMDGYPSGHGADLAKLCNVKITNGISGDGVGTANSMGCLAAQIICGLKNANKTAYHPTGVGGIYIEPTGGEIHDWVEYVYIVRGSEGNKPVIECTTKTGEWPFNIQTEEGHVFTGNSDRWLEFLKSEEEAA